MAMYATPSQLASYLQKDLDTASATLALETGTERFAQRANRRWAATTATYTLPAATFATSVVLPARNVTAVSAVRVNGVAVAVDYTLRGGVLYRLVGFGNPFNWPPDEVQIDYTYGLTAVPDDVKLGVLQIAGEIYEHPDPGVVSETIDDYSIKFDGKAIAASARDWREIADYYRGLLVA